MFSNLLDGIQAFAGDLLGTAHAPTNDAAAQSRPTRELPPLPFSPGAAPTSRPSSAMRGLSSPSTSSQSTRKSERAREFNYPLLAKPRISDDEKRLVGDFSTPADAVAIPDPRLWMGTNERQAAMNKKPGSSSSFRPVNTISDVNTAGPSRQVTYTRLHHPYPPPISRARHQGQLAFLERKSSRVPTSAHNTSSRDTDAHSLGGASPAKRRKTQHIITLDDDDDELEVLAVGSPSIPGTPAGTSFDVPLSARSSQSQFSTGSGSTITRSKQPSENKSEFRTTNALLDSRRKKSRTPGSNRNQGTQRSPPDRSGYLSRSNAPIMVHEDAPIGQDQSARRLMFHSFNQGESERSSEERQQTSHKRDIVTSHHFPNARINESTSGQPSNSSHTTRDALELRNQYRLAPSKSINVDSSEDELAMANPNETARTRVKSSSKARQAANSGVKRKLRAKEPSNGWPLVFARTREYERYGSVMGDGRAELSLRRSPSDWRVAAFDHTEGMIITVFEIRSQDVIKALADDVSRIRLEGPRSQNGDPPIFDLEFVDLSDFRQFRDEHAVLMTPSQKFIPTSESTMATMFSKSLKKKKKVETSDLYPEPIAEAHDDTEDVKNTSKTPLWNQLKLSTKDSNINAFTNNPTTTGTALRTLNRPKRSTRSLGPSHDLEAATNDHKVEKFSVDQGLGTRWTKPLEYGHGRQRAVVHFDDLTRLDEEEFLNDSLIDFYMIYLFDKLHVPSDKVYFFNTYFFTQLTKNSGRQSINYKAVERWTSKIDIFGYDYVVVPINEATHWYLAIICNVSKIARKPVVENFDDDLIEALAQSRRDLAKQTEENIDVTQQAESSDVPQIAKEDHSEQNHDDPNLFDEEAGLNLVDREYAGAGGDQASSVLHSVADVASEADLFPNGILSGLSTTSPKKKKAPRKSTQPKRDPNQPIIIILDSLGGVRSGTTRALKDWVAAEGKARRSMEAMIKEKGYYPKAEQIPQQSNSTDCGVYLLGYVEKFFQDPDLFKNKLLTGEMSAHEDWPELKPRDMRTNMRNIILKFAEDQRIARIEEKKAKKGCAKSKTSPSPIKEPSKSETKASQSEQFPSGGLGIGVTEPSRPQSAPMETPKSDVKPRIELSKLRLASPFHFDTPSVDAVARSQSPTAMGQLSHSPAVPTSLLKTASTTAVLRQTPKRKSPEVRIPVKTPQSSASTRNGQKISDGAARSIEHMHPLGGAISLTKRLRPDKDDGQLRLPVAKKRHTRSPQQQEKNHEERSSPSAARSREGSAGQPIMIDDSQEVAPVASQSHKTVQTGMSSGRKPPKRSPRRPQVLQHSPSIEEIPPPSPSAAERKHGQGLKAKGDEANDVSNRARRWVARSPKTRAKSITLYNEEKAASDMADAHSGDTSVREADGSTPEAVIRETPEAMRSSPRPERDGSLGP